jgi:hypothetical protein
MAERVLTDVERVVLTAVARPSDEAADTLRRVTYAAPNEVAEATGTLVRDRLLVLRKGYPYPTEVGRAVLGSQR